MTSDNLDVRLLSFRSRRNEAPQVLASELLSAGRIPEALEVVQAGLSDAEDDCGLLLLEGRAWFEQSDLAQAQAAFMRAAKGNPREKEPYRWLAQVLMKRGEPMRAVQALDRALLLDPGDPTLQQARGRAQRLARIADEADAGRSEPGAQSEPEPGSEREITTQWGREPAAEPPPASDPLASSHREDAGMLRDQPPVPIAVHEPALGLQNASQSTVALSAPLRAPGVVAARSQPPRGSASVQRLPAPAASLAPRPVGEPAQRPRANPLEAARSADLPRGEPAVNPPVSGAEPSELNEAVVASLARVFVRPEPVVQPVPSSARAVAQPEPAAIPGAWPPGQTSVADHNPDDLPTVAYGTPPELARVLDEYRASVAAAPAPAKELPTAPYEPDIGHQRRVLDIQPETSEPAGCDTDDDEVFARDTEVPASMGLAAHMAVPEASPAAKPTMSPDDTTDRVYDSGPANPDPESPEVVLGMLRDQGIFESAVDETGASWVANKEALRPGNRLGASLAVGWTLALLAAGGGYYGWTEFLASRRAQARDLIARAGVDAHEGDHERLVAAERRLIQARGLDPKSNLAIEGLLFVHAARALEDAAGEIGYLRTTIARAERASAPKGLLLAARALLHTYDRSPEAARRDTKGALKAGANDARVLYLVGRLHQRMGVDDAEALLSQAAMKDPALSLAWLGQAEIAHQTGREDEAAQLFDRARGADRAQLRAELWGIVLATGGSQASEQLRKLDALAPRVERGSPGDRLLARLARDGVLLQSGDLEGARKGVKAASHIVVHDPELLSLLANRAASVGEHDLAYRAASAAMATAPGNRRYRDALASVLLKRGDGRAVLAALGGIEGKGAWLLTTRARAALLSGSREAAEEAKRALSAHRQSDEGHDDIDAAALLVRLDLRLGANAESLLAAARTLAQQAGESRLAITALGETLVLAGHGDAAIEVLERARGLGAEDADVHYLLASAYRLKGRADDAQASLEHALALAPGHVQARQVLGGLLLERGEFASAESMFAGLERERVGISATLGVVDALLGRGEVVAARERVTSLTDADRALPEAQALSARVAIADGRAAEAVKLVAPLVAEESELRTPATLVLYGDALYATNSVDSAAGAYDAALELDPTHPDALIGRAMAALRAEKVKQVYELLTAAEQALTTRMRPPVVRARLQVARAKAHIQEGQFDAARMELAQAVGVPGIAPDAFFWYGETLAKSKNVGAAEQYMRYLELEPGGEFAGRAKKALAPR